MKPLFNGKDLTGWKEFPGKKSKFTVTTEGWINLKDGPGDLQTEGQWADFVLQLECISNGKHSTAASSSAAGPASISRATRPRSTTASPTSRRRNTPSRNTTPRRTN